MKSQRNLQAQLKTAQAITRPIPMAIGMSQSLQSRPKRKIVFNPESFRDQGFKKNKTPDTQARQKKHSTNDTNGRHKNSCNPRQTRTPAYNSTYKKLAVQCLNDPDIYRDCGSTNIRSSYQSLSFGMVKIANFFQLPTVNLSKNLIFMLITNQLIANISRLCNCYSYLDVVKFTDIGL